METLKDICSLLYQHVEAYHGPLWRCQFDAVVDVTGASCESDPQPSW